MTDEEAVLATLEDYADAYCAKDITRLMAVFDDGDDISLIGTGADEFWDRRSEIQAVFLRSFSEATAAKFSMVQKARNDLRQVRDRRDRVSRGSPWSSGPADYAFAEWRLARVSLDYQVEFDGFFYSVPHGLIREQVDIRATTRTIELFHRGPRVAAHQGNTLGLELLGDRYQIGHRPVEPVELGDDEDIAVPKVLHRLSKHPPRPCSARLLPGLKIPAPEP